MSSKKYRIHSVDECLKYITSHGLKIDDWSPTLSIPSECALLYELPNKEIVLVPTRVTSNYSGLIISGKKTLKEMIDNDYFPVDEKYLTFWEVERDSLEELPKSVSVYTQFITGELGFESKSLGTTEIKAMYDSLMKSLKSKIHPAKKDRLCLAFALVVMNYMVNSQDASWQFDKRFTDYNSYKYPYIKVENEVVDVISLLYSSVEFDGDNFMKFSQYVGLPLDHEG